MLSPTRYPVHMEEDEDEGRESLELDLPIQVHSRPVTPATTPRIDVFNGSSEHVQKKYSTQGCPLNLDNDESIVLAAQELGISIPPEPKANLDLSDGNVSTVTISSSFPETNTVQSRTSQSTRPTSFNSSVQQAPPPRITSPIMSSARTTHSRRSPTSSIAPSTRSSYSKIRKSIRRLSTFGRRLSTAPASPTLTDSDSLAPSLRWSPRPPTARSSTVPRDRQRSPPTTTHQMTAMILPSLSESRLSAVYPPSTFTQQPALMTMTPPPEETEEPDERTIAAKERSANSKKLQHLRLQQLEEQSTFLKSHFSSIDKIRSQHTEERRRATCAHNERREALQARHTERNAELETRHLGAEMDLVDSLAAERRACETKLKHMDAYCNNRQSLRPPGASGPARTVTEMDYRKLVEQYNVRDGMASLHEGRINVLREKQAKQLERVAARQEAELQALQDQTAAEIERKEATANKEEAELRRDFEFKKDKLVWRWKVMEAIERRRLELERGEVYAELPEVQWAEEGWLKAAL